MPISPGRAVRLLVLMIVSAWLLPQSAFAVSSVTPHHAPKPARTHARPSPAKRSGTPARARSEALPTIPIATATISGTPVGQAIPSGYLGFSFEYSAMHLYEGRDPDAVNPMLLGLIKLLNPDQSPVIRIGGDSSDDTWWPIPGMTPPGGIYYSLTKGWLRTTQAFATDLGAKLILGVNLEADRPAIAAAEGRALVNGIGAKNIAALEIGNEPDLYGSFYWYGNRLGQGFFGRPPTYSVTDFISQFVQWRSVLPDLPLAGPTFASTPWMADLGGFLSAIPGDLAYVTFHRYPLRGCESIASEPDYATIPNLLADRSSLGLAQQVAPFVTQSHAAGVKFRLDELNSVACSGKSNVSNTFASSLWMLDTLFNMAAVGVDGVNVHTLPGSAYQPFTFTDHKGTWSADVEPDYYGMLMFAQAAPPGSRLLQVTATQGPVKVWAVQTPSGHTNVVVINQDPSNTYQVHLSLPGAQTALTATAMTASSEAATSGVTIGGQSFPANTTTPALQGNKTTSTVTGSGLGGYDVPVPAGSALLLTR